MGRVQRDKRKLTFQDSSHHRLRTAVILFFHAAVTPEDERIGPIERRVAQALVWIVELGVFDDKPRLFFQAGRDRLAEKLRAVSLLLLRFLLVPDEHANRFDGP